MEIIETSSSTQPKLPRLRQRFSLASLLLLLATVACLAGWVGAARRAELARSEATTLRRANEAYRAELGFLDVVDDTKVHVVGRPPRAINPNSWSWRMYFPPGRYRLHAYHGPSPPTGLTGVLTEMPLGNALQLEGSQELDLEIRFDASKGAQVATISLDGNKHSTLFEGEFATWRWQGVRWGERRAFEPGEPIGMLMGEQVTAGDTVGNAFVFWIQPLKTDSTP